jgi:disulfide oxidoreductase YuzD
MGNNPISIEIFGATIQCASCVNAPSSKDTYEWLKAAIDRKYPNTPYNISYIDIEQPIENDRHAKWAQRVIEDKFFYPLVLINNEVIGEGYIQLKPICQELEKLGFLPA